MLFSDNPAVTTLDRINIEKFCAFYYDAKEQMGKRQFGRARDSYFQLLEIYKELKQAGLAPIHISVAHHCTNEVYQELNQKMDQMPLSPSSFKLMFIFTVIVLVIGLGLILRPSLSGLAIFSQEPVYTFNRTEFHISGLTVWDLNSFFSGEKLSFLVTDSDILDVKLEGSKLYLMPRQHGVAEITLIAKSADSPGLTKVPVTIKVGR